MADSLLFAAVLAGGRSTRMGQDKRFLLLDGEPLVDRAMRLAAAALGGDSSRVLLCGAVPQRHCIPDAMMGLGPLGGLLTAAGHVQSKATGEASWLLILPVDMPLLDDHILRGLVTAVGEGGTAAAISYAEHEMPFILRIDSSTSAALASAAGNPLPSLRSIRELQRRVGIRHISRATVPPHQLVNVNFPQEWSLVQKGGA